MTLAEMVACVDARVRPLLVRLLPARWVVAFYSWARQVALHWLVASTPASMLAPPPSVGRVLWGLRFRAPLFNAAGMFKTGEGYELAYRQGAGAYLAGTTTALPRMGNIRRGIALPFVPYPHSAAASNWLGLPNPGHRAVAARIATFPRYEDFPIGVSVALDPGMDTTEALERLLEGLWLYRDAGVDFFELNESCPNTGDDTAGFDALAERLRVITERFVRPSGAPVLIKVGADANPAMIAELVALAGSLGFGGITIGNTSTDYQRHRLGLASPDRRVFDYFVRTFGGGISGEPLRADVLERVVVARTAAASLPSEFHIVATGGIASSQHLADVLAAGATLAQWYTGYFERFARDGHELYRTVLTPLVKPDPLPRGYGG
ncbi:MAG: dihydroorotate dehydrogenase (quinone) [Candidatus Kapaibacterium sp.]|nr:MAG: dihydroorotate dehydrogenase (quinone) [Candidatus Kapabacteria bacterium]